MTTTVDLATPALCDCPERGPRVAAIQWRVLVAVPAVLSLHTLETGRDRTEEVPGGMYDGATFCCAECFAEVLAGAKREAVEGTLEVRLLESWVRRVAA